MDNNDLTIQQAANAYLDAVHLARSQNTTRTYGNALNIFLESLRQHGVQPDARQIIDFPQEALIWLIGDLKAYAPGTERLYLQAVIGFFEFVSAESLAPVNLTRMRLLIRQRARRPGQRLPQFPEEEIEKILTYTQSLVAKPSDDRDEHWRNLRDRAFLLTLADTGLRVHEACGLRRGDLDWNNGQALVIGKGNQEAVVRFSKRALAALKDYLAVRATLDGASGKPLGSLPIFARHDRGTGNKVQMITTATGRNIVKQVVRDAIGPQAIGTITPHSFRHYFVTKILKGSGNLKLAQALARHKNISVTQRYAHLADDELDRGYWDIFEG
jgi:site-specific recombinase XerD